MIMTPGYASPEQIAGEGSGKTGDIYSVAVVLYQLLTGRLPVRRRARAPERHRAIVGGPAGSAES